MNCFRVDVRKIDRGSRVLADILDVVTRSKGQIPSRLGSPLSPTSSGASWLHSGDWARPTHFDFPCTPRRIWVNLWKAWRRMSAHNAWQVTAVSRASVVFFQKRWEVSAHCVHQWTSFHLLGTCCLKSWNVNAPLLVLTQRILWEQCCSFLVTMAVGSVVRFRFIISHRCDCPTAIPPGVGRAAVLHRSEAEGSPTAARHHPCPEREEALSFCVLNY